VPAHGGLETAEAEVAQPGLARRIAVRVREPGAGQRHRTGIAQRRETIDDRAARIAEAQELRHLVVGLARGVVTGTAEPFHTARRGDEVEARVSSRRYQHHRGLGHLTVFEHEGLDMAGQMVHGDERDAGCPRKRLGEGKTHEQGADQPGALGHGQCVDLDACLGERALDHAADVADVLSGGELGHHPSPLPVQIHLRSHDVRQHPPRPVAGARLLDDGRSRLVAGGLDAQDGDALVRHTTSTEGARPISAANDASYGGRAMPRSVTMAVT
jgi:hypothetical protein